jgi:hypothetical protein
MAFNWELKNASKGIMINYLTTEVTEITEITIIWNTFLD